MATRGNLLAIVVTLAAAAASACTGSATSPSAVAPLGANISQNSAAGTTRSTLGGGSATGGADLQVSGSASTGSPNAGSSFGYTFQVKNSGPTAAAAASFSDALPAGMSYNAATVNGASAACSFLDPIVTCDLGTLASGGQAVVAVSVFAPTAVGAYANTGSATSSTADPNTANNAVTVTVQIKTPSVDTIKVSKCYTNATATSWGEMLIKAASSDPTARLFAYRPDGTYQGEVQNGGGSRYGGTVMGFVPFDPGSMIIKSSSGGSVTAPTTPFIQ